jgi:peptidase E
MAKRQIIAMGGGGCHMDANHKNKLDNWILSIARRGAPIRIVLLATAGGDDPREINFALEYFAGQFCQYAVTVTVVRLFTRTLKDAQLRQTFLDADLVYVMGGNTVSMLAVWRAHGVDKHLREAYDGGTVMAGLSAGGICWFEQGLLSDSLGPEVLEPVEGLGFLKGSFSPHHGNEPLRQPAMMSLIQQGRLKPGYGADDGVALHFVDEELVAVHKDGREGAGCLYTEMRDGKTHVSIIMEDLSRV